MRHLISKKHHPHFKKRALLELFGLMVLVGLSINQRELIISAINSIKESDSTYLLIMFVSFWPLLFLTALNYKFLADKKIPLVNTTLAQLAAAGPGRIIPGGLGQISISAVYLQKIGIKTTRAILISVANNFIGLLINIILIVLAVIFHPTLLADIRQNLSLEILALIGLSFVAVLTILQWLYHLKSTRKTFKKIVLQWKHVATHLKKKPRRLLYVIFISIAITVGYSLVLMLAGKALAVHISLADAIIALSMGVLLGGTLPTPGGFGAVEAGTAGALIVIGYDPAQATSASLLFRAATYWQPLLPGLISYLYLRKRKLL